MAKSLVSKTPFVALLFLFLIVAASEMRVAEAKYCSKKSHEWSGPCLNSYKCGQHCKDLGYQYGGVCHKERWGHYWKYACLCYYHC